MKTIYRKVFTGKHSNTQRAFFVLSVVSLFSLLALRFDDNIGEALQAKLYTYIQENPSTTLYLHIDKNNYSPNEDIWFKAYVLSGQIIDNKVLFIRLTDRNKKIMASDKFAMYDIRSNGDLTIPDSLKDGEYYLYAYTDRMLNFAGRDLFVQPITITRDMAKRLDAEASVTDSTKLVRGEKVEVMVKLKEGEDLLKGIRGNYSLSVGEKEIKTGRITTSLFGEALINFTYPKIADDESVKLTVKFRRNADFSDLVLNLEHEGSPTTIKVFPEGGHLVEGLMNKMVVTATDVKNNPVQTELLLKEGRKLLGKAKTNARGEVVFSFKPMPEAKYSLMEVGENKLATDLSNNIELHGYVLSLKNKNGKRIFRVYNQEEQENSLIVLRSLNEILWTKATYVNRGDSADVSLPLDEYPKGLLSIAVIGNDGKPKAERLFFNKAKQDYTLLVKTDSITYKSRKKVNVTLRLTDINGAPMRGNFSVAVSETVRLNQPTYRDISSYYYSKGVNDLLENNQNAAMASNFDDLLITKKWWNPWENVVSYHPKGSIRLLKYGDGIVGVIKPLPKRQKLPKELIVMSGMDVSERSVDANGFVYIPSDVLLTPRGKKRYLFLNEQFYENYNITLSDYETEYDSQLRYGQSLKVPQTFNAFVKYEEDKKVKKFANAIQLKAVTINGNQTSDKISHYGTYVSTNCNDMVCMYGILNCRNHPGCCSIPIEGQTYRINGILTLYRGCGKKPPGSILLKTINVPKTFYVQDYDKQPSAEPEPRSTIFWAPNVSTNAEGKANFSFFTSDIKGEFYIMAQGVDLTAVKPLYGKTTFTVK